LQRRWQDGCRIWPLLARGFGYTLDVVPGAVCTTARWMCQALFHVRAKLHWAYARHVPKEQTLAAQEASTRIIRWWARRPAGGDAPGRSRAARPVSAADAASPGSTHSVRQPNARYAATPAGSSRAAAGRSAAGAGRHHSDGAGALFPFGPAADRDHGRLDVRAPDRRLDRAAQFAPGVTFLRAARKAIA
jgi:hypothetical protein